MNNVYTLAGAVVIAGIMISGAIIYSNTIQNDNDREAKVADESSENNEDDGARSIDIDIEGWPKRGDIDAPVVIVEYSDYVCPFSKRLKDETISRIKENYVNEGRVLLVYKDLPVGGGDRAAEAAHCAGEQNAFWEYHEMLYENQANHRGSWNDPEIHGRYAEDLGLDADELVECFEERRYRDKVLGSAREAQSLGGRGTPFVIVNGRSVSGAQPYEVFRRLIEEGLEG